MDCPLHPIAVRRTPLASVRRQLAAQLECQILAGRLSPGRRLPSVRALAARVGVHRNTAAAAYQMLRERELVVPVRGSGVYVAFPPNHPRRAAPSGAALAYGAFLSDRRAAGETPGQVVRTMESWAEGVARRRILLLCDEPALADVVALELTDRLAPITVRSMTAEEREGVSTELHGWIPVGIRPPDQGAPMIHRPHFSLRLGVQPPVLRHLRRLSLPGVVAFVSDSRRLRDLVRDDLHALAAGCVGVLFFPHDRDAWERIAGQVGVILVDRRWRELAPPRLRPRMLLVRVVAERSVGGLSDLLGPADVRRKQDDPGRRGS